ncbi:MAG: 50S ribosomal protein L2 [Candidatus Collierbacteria bacterium GW2011_GWF1_44_12]|uniref:50S ribosomal protein L2 n=3 Tax=Candidatus Collieribacteriota TaxID=1752725 RepID=A0A0G1RKL6_9BACT|nr:MAG: 50S ribosomal protein L2 [Candidatus Collierbacteria bacterium GW2011_GWF1_44_12]KKU00393.1 MAG: 50S ribosomal protein L2 [Candidatus Collierbacteria bacterium GW2011_GWC2_45_15]KKU30543.1 MAG: 50S ribosomal protein L2 [Candidatus Collierbacteria bacterium GW2011_GWE1_46_18]
MKVAVPKRLKRINPKSSGRNSSGKITVRHQGGREKRQLRHIDWKRNTSVPAKVISIQYDPNRTVEIALLAYQNGLKDYILAPQGLKIGDLIQSSEAAEIKPGNCLPLRNIPIGVQIHNLEIMPGKGAQMVRSAGNFAVVQSKEEDKILVKLPSGEIRSFNPAAKATVGALGQEHHKEEQIGSAGRARHMGRRPTVRGVAQDPRSHPHGGGEGRSGIGLKSPKSVYGKRVMGVRTRNKKKHSNHLIIKRRGKK